MARRIVLVEVENFRNIHSIRFEPEGRALVRLRGANGQGKSAFAEALAWCYQPANANTKNGVDRKGDVITHGKDKAVVTIVHDDGVRITKTETAKGRSVKITQPDGSAWTTQEKADELFGSQFFDISGFLALDPKAQLEALPGAAALAPALRANTAARTAAYDERTAEGKLAKAAEGKLAGLPAAAPLPPLPEEREVSVSALLTEVARLRAIGDANAAKRAELDASKARWNGHRAALDAAKATVERLAAEATAASEVLATADAEADVEMERQIADIRARFARDKAARAERYRSATERRDAERGKALALASDADQAKATELAVYNALKAEVDALTDPDTAAVEAQIASAETTNAAIRARRAAAETVRRDAERDARDRETLAQDAAKHKAAQAALTQTIAALDAERATLLASIPVPLEGLSASEDGLLWEGTVLANASKGQQHRVAFHLARTQPRRVAFLSIRDGAYLDGPTIAEVERAAREDGIQVYLELAPTSDDPAAFEFVAGEIVNVPDGGPAQLGLGVA